MFRENDGEAMVRQVRVRRPAVSTRWRRGPLGSLSAWLLVCALIVDARPASGQPGPPLEVPVVVVRVAERPVRGEVTFIGTVEPDRAVTVQAEVAGRVARAEPREGDPVVGGQTVIADLDRTPNELSLKEARAVAAKARQEWEKLARGYRREEIEQARAAVAEAETRRIWAEQELRRMEELFARGLIAAQERDRAWQAHEVTTSQERAAREKAGLAEAGPRVEDIAQAEAEHQRATFVVERLEDELKRMRIIAPLTGFLVRKRVEVGAWAKAGDPIADLIALDPAYVVGPVSEREVGRLRRGARARVTLDAYPDRTFSGEVTHIVPQADPQSRAFPVKVRIRNPDHLLKSGMFGRVALEIPGNRRAVYVPKDAVVRRDNGSMVYVVENGVAKARPVRTGQAAGEMIEIMDGALASGQEVVVVGNEALRDGARVRKVDSRPAGGGGPGQLKGR